MSENKDKKVSFEVHESHIPLWENDTWRYAIIMGGRGNGRSGTASRYVISQLLGKEYLRGAIMRATREDIRPSSWSNLIDRINEQDITSEFHIKDNEMVLERGQNSIRAHGFRASSGSLTARLKSLEGYNLVWIEEAEEIGENEFRTLDDTLRTIKGRIRIILTLNSPSKSHWLIKRWFDLDPAYIDGFHAQGFYIPKVKESVKDVLYIGGTYRENLPNLDTATVERYKEYRETKPSYYWQVIEGLVPEVLMGKIYSGWKVIDEVPHEARLLGYGLDFGFHPDPAAIVAIYYYNGGYILDEELYQTRLLNQHLATTIKSLPEAPVVPDSAEPKSIAELQAEGINVIPAEKGPDSVRYGIKLVQNLKISYTKRSLNLAKEYEDYSWKVTKDGDELPIPDPAKADHALDAARYGLSLLAGKTHTEYNKVAEKQVEIFIRGRNAQKQNDTR